MNYEDLINTAVDVGYLLISNGGEIYRAEESMLRIFRAYGVDTGEVFAIPTFINATVSTPQGRPVTKLRRIAARETNMDRVEQANDLCRRICRTTPDFACIRREIARIEKRPSFPFSVQTAAFALVAFSFTLFYGGNWADALIALVCGAVTKVVFHVLRKFRVNTFFVNILASFAAALLALWAAHLWAFLSYDKIIIGALMNLVPGIAITDFMRDIIAGDLIAGILRLTESTLVAAAIAIGAAFALTATRMLWGV